jgi:hypothetical protein
MRYLTSSLVVSVVKCGAATRVDAVIRNSSAVRGAATRAEAAELLSTVQPAADAAHKDMQALRSEGVHDW